MSKKEQRNRYSDSELQEFDQLIIEKIEKAKEQLEFYESQLAEINESGETRVRGLDDGVGTSESERLNMMINRSKKHITYLENARARIANKVYGVCRETGKLISKDRLRAVPHATLSIEAKQLGKR
ncbi:MAG: TraR/DksA family transcriptional regulator [Saprospirales bacterium]|nr:MAG: TraR/DksA family transcriptional regulator [Saprospirales bacterium]